MKILFVMRHSGYVRNFESTLRLLCERGHTVQLAFQIAGTHWLLDPTDVSRELAATYPNFTRDVIPVREDAFGYAARDHRLTLDYLRYLGPEYRGAPKLRERAARELPPDTLERTRGRLGRTAAGRRALAAWLRLQLRAVPTDPRIDAFLEVSRPDVLVVTPLIEPGAPQAEYLRSARQLGIRTALCVASWDNLTNKGLVHGPVDLVAVWNDAMRREAMTMHGIAPERIAVTGAQPFDHWFGWQPSMSREAFCHQVGLPPHRPYVLYLCSSKFIAPEEAPFVRGWLTELRQAGLPAVAGAGVLVRPHPQNADQWREADLTDCGPVSIWPPQGQAPSDDKARADYFDSIYYSSAVVGINTTAEIESAIIGRPVFSVLAPEFRDTQEGTLHFEHLKSVNGGLLHLAPTMDEHVRALEKALTHQGADDERCRRFVEAFVRPQGIDVPSTPRLVEALERLAATPVSPAEAEPLIASALRPRLLRHGHRLQHLAMVIRETKAAKARKKHRKAAADSAPPTDRKARSWRDLAGEFRTLGYHDRVRFGHETADVAPSELLLERARPERLDYPDAEIYLRVISKRERERLKACAKEPFTVQWIREQMRPDDVFYDIGANVGAYSLIAAKQPGGGARVFAFEASYANVSSLCANIVLNGVADRITPVPVALSAREELTVFGLRALEPGGARHTLGDGPAAEGPVLYRQPVMTCRLDTLIERFALPLPNHIKLDVDGGEADVIAGASRTLASPALRSLLVEVSIDQSAAISEALLEYGLRLDTRVNVQNTDGEQRVWYGLFTRTPDGTAPARDPHVQTVAR